MADIHRLMQPLRTTKSPFSEHVKIRRRLSGFRPELVCTVKYIEWTPDGRLRAPAFAGLAAGCGAQERSASCRPNPARRPRRCCLARKSR